MDQLLTLNPADRITARQALDHEYFKAEPTACDPSKLPKIEVDTHEYQVMNRMKVEQMKLFAKKENADESVPILGKKRKLPKHFALPTKIKEPPIHIK